MALFSFVHVVWVGGGGMVVGGGGWWWVVVVLWWLPCLTQLLSYVLFGVVEEVEVRLRQFIIVLFFGIYVSPKTILMKRFLKNQYAFRFFLQDIANKQTFFKFGWRLFWFIVNIRLDYYSNVHITFKTNVNILLSWKLIFVIRISGDFPEIF